MFFVGEKQLLSVLPSHVPLLGQRGKVVNSVSQVLMPNCFNLKTFYFRMGNALFEYNLNNSLCTGSFMYLI